MDFQGHNYFKFLDFKNNLKAQLSAIEKMYIACTLLQNARCCLHSSATSKYFEVQPPTPGVPNGTSKNVGLGKFWQDLEISEAFLISLEVSFFHGLFLLF